MITAFVNITVPAKRSGNVVEELKKWPQVKEAAAVYGQTDVVAKIQTESLLELDSIVMDIIQSMPKVEMTRTFVVIEDLHWER